MKSFSLDELQNKLERKYLIRALASANNNRTEAARLLGLQRSTFLMKIRKHGLKMDPSPMDRKLDPTRCLRGHLFDEANTYHYASKGRPRRRCLECYRQRNERKRLEARGIAS